MSTALEYTLYVLFWKCHKINFKQKYCLWLKFEFKGKRKKLYDQ
jgi:hypothetical protein